MPSQLVASLAFAVICCCCTFGQVYTWLSSSTSYVFTLHLVRWTPSSVAPCQVRTWIVTHLRASRPLQLHLAPCTVIALFAIVVGHRHIAHFRTGYWLTAKALRWSKHIEVTNGSCSALHFLCATLWGGANTFEFCKSLRCKSIPPLVQSYSDFLYLDVLGQGGADRAQADTTSPNLTHQPRCINTQHCSKSKYSKLSKDSLEWHVTDQKCSKSSLNTSKYSTVLEQNSPMNSFLRRFLSLSWGVEMTKQLMNARSTVLQLKVVKHKKMQKYKHATIQNTKKVETTKIQKRRWDDKTWMQIAPSCSWRLLNIKIYRKITIIQSTKQKCLKCQLPLLWKPRLKFKLASACWHVLYLIWVHLKYSVHFRVIFESQD